ncbi:DNA cytosine methyltransferase [Enterococcus sp. AZ058]|uniref:DNA cytosine methyltransferase n=1 Tax=unclassified Enterococcus TaxID=2608891 RepID=UPI003D2E7665
MGMKTIDLFAGCGGMSTGFELAGFNILAAYENWEKAANVYRTNLNHEVHSIDLSNVPEAVSSIRKYNPDIIIGGPPCQDFSSAGKRIESDRASLTEDFATIIKILRPISFVMENVDRARKSNSYAKARRIFKKAGYGLTEIVLDSSFCDTPQKRKRFFCIGVLEEKDGFLENSLTGDLSSQRMTMRDYFGDSLGIDYYYRHPRNYNRRGVFSMDEPSPTIRGVNRPVPIGYKGHPNDSGEVSSKLRPLTTRERALVQTFPETFKWEGTKTDLEQMIGNAVPVNLAKYIAKHLEAYLNDRREVFGGFGKLVDCEQAI